MNHIFKRFNKKLVAMFAVLLCAIATISPIYATTLEVEDEPIGPKLSIYKISEYKDKDDNDIPIEGVVFKIYSDPSMLDTYWIEDGTTNSKGIINFNFEMKENCKYYIREYSVPSDNSYKLDTKLHSLELNSYIPATKTCTYTYDGVTYTETNQGSNINLSDTSSDWSNMKFTLTLTNSPNNKPFYEDLPMTGGQQIVLLGIGTVLIVLLVIATKKKKEKHE